MKISGCSCDSSVIMTMFRDWKTSRECFRLEKKNFFFSNIIFYFLSFPEVCWRRLVYFFFWQDECKRYSPHSSLISSFSLSRTLSNILISVIEPFRVEKKIKIFFGTIICCNKKKTSFFLNLKQKKNKNKN